MFTHQYPSAPVGATNRGRRPAGHVHVDGLLLETDDTGHLPGAGITFESDCT